MARSEASIFNIFEGKSGRIRGRNGAYAELNATETAPFSSAPGKPPASGHAELRIPAALSNMATLATIRGSTSAPSDVHRVPVELFWPCLLRAVHFSALPTVDLIADRPVDRVATSAWIAWMSIARATGLLSESALIVLGDEAPIRFVDTLRKHAGPSARSVFESMESRDAMEGRIAPASKSAQAGQASLVGSGALWGYEQLARSAVMVGGRRTVQFLAPNAGPLD